MRLLSLPIGRRWRRPRPAGRPPAPFVVGVARSGTTLLRLMLDAHPEVTIPPETHFLPKLFRTLEPLAKRGAPAGEIREAARELITTHPRWGDFGVEPERLEAHLERANPTPAGAARAFYEAYAQLHGKPRWGDKSPSYVRKMPRIQATLPEASFVHLIRDGRDVALSLSEVTWGVGDVREAAERWRREVLMARRRARRLAPGTYLEIRYEDLVTDPEPVLRRVADHVALPWDGAMLAYHHRADERMREVVRELRPGGGGTITAEERARQHELVSRPPSTQRTGRWRTEMEPADREAFESVAGKLLANLGYER